MSLVSLAFSYIKRERLFSPADSKVTVSRLHAVITLTLFSPHFWMSRWFIGLEVNYAAHHIVSERPFIHGTLSLSHLSNSIDYARFLSSRRGDSVTFLDVPLVVLLFNSISYRTARTPGLDCRHVCALRFGESEIMKGMTHLKSSLRLHCGSMVPTWL